MTNSQDTRIIYTYCPRCKKDTAHEIYISTGGYLHSLCTECGKDVSSDAKVSEIVTDLTKTCDREGKRCIHIKYISSGGYIHWFCCGCGKDVSGDARVTGGGGGGCHITKVVLYARGLPDDCHELNELRKFRDEYLNKEGYSDEVDDYYKNSLKYAECIEKKANKNPRLYDELYEKYILPAINAIEENDMKKAHRILQEYLTFVKEKMCNDA